MGEARTRPDGPLESIFGFATLLREAPFPMGIREIRDDDIVHVADNAALAALFAKAPEDLVGKSERELGVEPGLVRRAIELLRRARAGQTPAQFELSFGIVTASALEGTAHALPLGDHGRELYLIVAQDVSELRRLQSDLLELDRLTAAGVFAASVAHEILNPAGAARYLCERAMSSLAGGDNTEALRALDGIREGLDQIIAVTTQLRSFSSPRPRSHEPVELAEIVTSVLTLAGAQLRNEARIAVELAASPALVGDAVALRQLVLNLLRNAVRAVSKGREARHVRVILDQVDGQALIEVRDDGPGFPAAILERPFSAFQTGDGGGSGLGLYVCKRIVDDHGGSIELSNLPQGGARVRVLLPALTSESV